MRLTAAQVPLASASALRWHLLEPQQSVVEPQPHLLAATHCKTLADTECRWSAVAPPADI